MNAVGDALASRARWLVSGSAGVVLLLRRDAVVVSFLLGAIANALVTKVLKWGLAIPRPDGAPLADPGMPSSHASSLFFFATWLGAAALARRADDDLGLATALGLVALLVCTATALAAWRVRRGLHSADQVLVGALLGAGAALLWRSQSEPLEHALDALIAATTGSWMLGAAGLLAIIVAGVLVVGAVERLVLYKPAKPDTKAA